MRERNSRGKGEHCSSSGFPCGLAVRGSLRHHLSPQTWQGWCGCGQHAGPPQPEVHCCRACALAGGGGRWVRTPPSLIMHHTSHVSSPEWKAVNQGSITCACNQSVSAVRRWAGAGAWLSHRKLAPRAAPAGAAARTAVGAAAAAVHAASDTVLPTPRALAAGATASRPDAPPQPRRRLASVQAPHRGSSPRARLACPAGLRVASPAYHLHRECSRASIMCWGVTPAGRQAGRQEGVGRVRTAPVHAQRCSGQASTASRTCQHPGWDVPVGRATPARLPSHSAHVVPRQGGPPPLDPGVHGALTLFHSAVASAVSCSGQNCQIRTTAAEEQ